VVLIACATSKQNAPSAARDLYISTLFREARRFAEFNADLWFILSALHGIVEPEEVIAPYERTLNEMPVAERRDWATGVNRRLPTLLPSNACVTILAGKKYREFIEPFLRERRFEVRTPLAHLGIGRQVQWLQRANISYDNHSRGVSPMALSDLTSSSAVLQAIKEFHELGREEFLRKYGFGHAKQYFLAYEGRRYDSKAIVGAAHGYQFPEQGPLRASDFSGGEKTVQAKLEELGFEVDDSGEK
jgi:hypothetical protein